MYKAGPSNMMYQQKPQNANLIQPGFTSTNTYITTTNNYAASNAFKPHPIINDPIYNSKTDAKKPGSYNPLIQAPV
jgi:hypothetical protein